MYMDGQGGGSHNWCVEVRQPQVLLRLFHLVWTRSHTASEDSPVSTPILPSENGDYRGVLLYQVYMDLETLTRAPMLLHSLSNLPSSVLFFILSDICYHLNLGYLSDAHEFKPWFSQWC